MIYATVNVEPTEAYRVAARLQLTVNRDRLFGYPPESLLVIAASYDNEKHSGKLYLTFARAPRRAYAILSGKEFDIGQAYPVLDFDMYDPQQIDKPKT